MTGKTLCQKVSVKQLAWANDVILAGAHPALDTANTENDSEFKNQVEENKLHRMTKFNDFLKSWQGFQILRATQKESPAQSKQMTAIVYISNTEVIFNASWSLL